MLRKKNRDTNSGYDLGSRLFAERVNNEDGFVLILSMMVLVVLTLLGMSGTRNAIIETQIAGNDNMAKILFYDAESAAHEAAQRLRNEKDHDALKADRPSENDLVVARYVDTPSGKLDVEDGLLSDEQTEIALEKKEEAVKLAQDSVLAQHNITTQMIALDYGAVKGDLGSSLKMTESKVYFFKLVGRALLAKDIGYDRDKMIEIGYKKRY